MMSFCHGELYMDLYLGQVKNYRIPTNGEGANMGKSTSGANCKIDYKGKSKAINSWNSITCNYILQLLMYDG